MISYDIIYEINDLQQERRNRNALPMQLRLSSTNPSIYFHM